MQIHHISCSVDEFDLEYFYHSIFWSILQEFWQFAHLVEAILLSHFGLRTAEYIAYQRYCAQIVACHFSRLWEIVVHNRAHRFVCHQFREFQKFERSTEEWMRSDPRLWHPKSGRRSLRIVSTEPWWWVEFIYRSRTICQIQKFNFFPVSDPTKTKWVRHRAIEKFEQVLNLTDTCGYITFVNTSVPDIGCEQYDINVHLKKPKSRNGKEKKRESQPPRPIPTPEEILVNYFCRNFVKTKETKKKKKFKSFAIKNRHDRKLFPIYVRQWMDRKLQVLTLRKNR